MVSDLETLEWVNASPPPMNTFIPEPFKLLPIPSAIFAIWGLYRGQWLPSAGGSSPPLPLCAGKRGFRVH